MLRIKVRRPSLAGGLWWLIAALTNALDRVEGSRTPRGLVIPMSSRGRSISTLSTGLAALDRALPGKGLWGAGVVTISGRRGSEVRGLSHQIVASAQCRGWPCVLLRICGDRVAYGATPP